VLRVVRLSGAVHFRADFSEPWAILSSPSAALAMRLNLPAESAVTPFHVMTHGVCSVQSGKLPPVRLESGDIIVFPRGDQHALASDLALKPVPVRELYKQPEHGHIAVMQHGGGGSPAGFICGYCIPTSALHRCLNPCRRFSACVSATMRWCSKR
jgi:hypothetical protein